METCSYNSSEEIPWQATAATIMLEFKKEFLVARDTTNIISQKSSRELTKEATFMIFTMLSFVLLAILGSSFTIYEFFFIYNDKKAECKGNPKIQRKRQERLDLRISQAWFEDFKNFLKCFCLLRNGKKILNSASSKDQIDCFEGLRVIGNAWIILTHTAMVYMFALEDPKKMKTILEMRASQLLLNGIYFADIFLVISGFLNAYHTSRNYSERNGYVSWTFFYFKRFARLTPLYMIVIGFHTTLLTYTGNSIVWPLYDTNPVCWKNWWRYLFYINNFGESKKDCMLWCWYLAAEMQSYIISPLFIISLMRWPRFGYFLIFACIVLSSASSFMVTYSFNLSDGSSRFVFHLDDIRHFFVENLESYSYYYLQTYARISAYLVGLTSGFYLHNKLGKKNMTRNSKVTLYCGWIATAYFLWICFFSFHGIEKARLMDRAIYNGTKILFFSCGVAWIIYVSITGQAEYLSRCLSCRALFPLGRLSYSAYLIHPILLERKLLQTEKLLDFDLLSLLPPNTTNSLLAMTLHRLATMPDLPTISACKDLTNYKSEMAYLQGLILMVSMFFYVYVFTQIFSFIASIMFEVPVSNILDWLKKKTEKKTSRWYKSSSYMDTQNLPDIHKIS